MPRAATMGGRLLSCWNTGNEGELRVEGGTFARKITVKLMTSAGGTNEAFPLALALGADASSPVTACSQGKPTVAEKGLPGPDLSEGRKGTRCLSLFR